MRDDSTDLPARAHPKRNPHKDAKYVYQRVSESTGFARWWGDFRRFADVGGRLERLAPYLRPDEGEIRDAEHARAIYWRGVDLYQQKRRASAPAGDMTTSPPSPQHMVTGPSLQLVRGTAGTASNASITNSQAESVSPRVRASADVTSMLTQLLSESQAIKAQLVSVSNASNIEILGADLRLGKAATDHLAWKRQQTTRGNGRTGTCDTDETSFKALCRILGEDCRLGDITGQRLEVYITQRLAEPGWKKGTTISTATVRNELHALSNLFTKFADRDIIALPNPVSKVTMPAPPAEEAVYLQLTQVAHLLDACVLIDIQTADAVKAMEMVRRARALGARGRRRPPEAQALFDAAEKLYPTAERGQAWHRRFRYVEALVATLFYTGARSEEVRGLKVEEIDWNLNEIVLRHNEWRGLKRVHCTRRVPIPPELQRILRRYLGQTGIMSGLVFVGGASGMLGALQTIFPRAVALAGITGEVTPHSLRHTFATGMLHTYEVLPDGRAAQRSSHNVAKLLGHKNSKLVDETYGHLLWDAGMMLELSADLLRRLPSAR